MHRHAQHHILSVLVENKFGVLCRIAGLFSRRGYNIFSLAVSPTEDERYSRMTIVVDAESAPLEQVTKQLEQADPRHQDQRARADGRGRARAHARRRSRPTAEFRSQVTELASIFEAKILDVGYDAMTLMVAGTPEKLDAIDRAAARRSGSSSCSGRAGSRCPSSPASPAKLRAVKNTRAPDRRRFAPERSRGGTAMPATIYYDDDADLGAARRTARSPSSATAPRATPTP